MSKFVVQGRLPVAESVSIGSLSGRWVGQINTHPQHPTSKKVKYPSLLHGDSEASHTQPILWLVGQFGTCLEPSYGGVAKIHGTIDNPAFAWVC